jgi:DNA-directed RNA polymerase specialized sigma24 family protein
VAEDVELAEDVSIAMLSVLETLGPAERAVFVLREVFETPYHEIAEAVGKTTAAVRQIARRAREHVAARRPRMQVDRALQQAAAESSWPPSPPATCRNWWKCSTRTWS